MRDDDAASLHHRYIDRFLLLGAGHAQAVGLDGVVEDAIITAQAGRGHHAHEFFGLGRQRAFEIGIVIDVVEALYQTIARFVDVGV